MNDRLENTESSGRGAFPVVLYMLPEHLKQPSRIYIPVTVGVKQYVGFVSQTKLPVYLVRLEGDLNFKLLSIVHVCFVTGPSPCVSISLRDMYPERVTAAPPKTMSVYLLCARLHFQENFQS